MIARTLGLGLAAAIALGGAASAADVKMNLVNQSSDGSIMAFDPPVVKIKPGDTVTFVAKDPGHEADSIDGMIPDGAQPFKGENSKDLTVKFDKEGVYGVKCNPHFIMGMAGLVAVGDHYPNLAAAKAVQTNPEAKKRLDAEFAKLGQ